MSFKGILQKSKPCPSTLEPGKLRTSICHDSSPSQCIMYVFSACRNGKALELTSGRIQHLFQVDCSVKTWKYSWQGSHKHDSFRLELLQVPEDYEFHSFFLRILERASAQNLFLLSFFQLHLIVTVSARLTLAPDNPWWEFHGSGEKKSFTWKF